MQKQSLLPAFTLVVVSTLISGFAVACDSRTGDASALSESEDSPISASEVDLEAERVVGLSIAYHDPGSQWGTAPLSVDLEESRPDGTVRKSRFDYSPPSNYRVVTERNGQPLEFEIEGETLILDSVVDGGGELTEASALRTRNYYLFLYGLPMKLRDESAILSPIAERTEFEGSEAFEVRVEYEPEAGSDIWYFYFAPDDYRLIGYKFHHDEAKGDGETILLDGMAQVDSFRLPQVRTWYTNLDRKLLGTDTIVVP